MTIDELSGEIEVPVRTIHWYVQIGVLPPHEGPKKIARYTHKHIRAYLAYREAVPLPGNRVTAACFGEMRRAGLVHP